MAFFLIALGSAIAYLDYLGTANLKGAGTLLKDELFTDPTPFYKWLGALIIIALLGYIDEFRPISQGLLVLVIVSILLSHSGVVANIGKVL